VNLRCRLTVAILLIHLLSIYEIFAGRKTGSYTRTAKIFSGKTKL